MVAANNFQNMRAYSTRSRSAEHFPDPFCDMASLAMPQSIEEALAWCEHLILANGPYREALRRVVSYFITDIQIIGIGGKGVGREEKQKYTDFLNDTLGIREVLHDISLDYLTYGNSFTSLLIPFRRYLACPKEECGFELPFKRVVNTADFNYRWSNYSFHAKCPRCNFTGTWNKIDRRSGESGKIKVKRWNPHNIRVRWDEHSGDTEFLWRIPDQYRAEIRRGDPFRLERCSWEIVQAIEKNQDLLLDPDVIYHMRENTLAGVDNGWGISKVLTNFRQAWYVQVLHRFNEAIALDYVIPFRVLTPMPRPGQGGAEANDPVLSINMGDFVSRVQRMLAARRRDPARWNVLPFPLDYKALGGDASQLAPKELLELGMDALLNAIGVPVELYRGSLSVQAAPAALRLFEANWSHLTHKLNRFLVRLVDKISQIMSWEPVSARLQRVRHADDLNRQMALLQLMMGGQISRTTGLSNLNLEFEEEERRKLEEERITAEATTEAQHEMEQAAIMDEMAMPQQPQAGAAGAPAQGAPAQGAQQMPAMQGMPGAMPGGGMPPVPPAGAMGAPQGPGGAAQMFAANQPLVPNLPQTPEDMEAMATTLVQQLLPMADSQRKSTLIRLKKENSTIHALVVSQLEEVQRDAQQRGGEMLMAQEYGKAASAKPPSAARSARDLLRHAKRAPARSSPYVSGVLD